MNPVWNQKLSLNIKDLETPLRLQVFDHDRFKSDDLIGCGVISCNHLEANIPETQEVDLDTQGKIVLKLEYVHLQ